jgi:hypothetical protein
VFWRRRAAYVIGGLLQVHRSRTLRVPETRPCPLAWGFAGGGSGNGGAGRAPNIRSTDIRHADFEARRGIRSRTLTNPSANGTPGRICDALSSTF